MLKNAYFFVTFLLFTLNVQAGFLGFGDHTDAAKEIHHDWDTRLQKITDEYSAYQANAVKIHYLEFEISNAKAEQLAAQALLDTTQSALDRIKNKPATSPEKQLLETRKEIQLSKLAAYRKILDGASDVPGLLKKVEVLQLGQIGKSEAQFQNDFADLKTSTLARFDGQTDSQASAKDGYRDQVNDYSLDKLINKVNKKGSEIAKDPSHDLYEGDFKKYNKEHPVPLAHALPPGTAPPPPPVTVESVLNQRAANRKFTFVKSPPPTHATAAEAPPIPVISCDQILNEIAALILAKPDSYKIINKMVKSAAIKMVTVMADPKNKETLKTMEAFSNQEVTAATVQDETFKNNLTHLYLDSSHDAEKISAKLADGKSNYFHRKSAASPGQAGVRFDNSDASAFIFYLSQKPEYAKIFQPSDAAAVWAQGIVNSSVPSRTGNASNFSTQVYLLNRSGKLNPGAAQKLDDEIKLQIQEEVTRTLAKGEKDPVVDALSKNKELCLQNEEGTACNAAKPALGSVSIDKIKTKLAQVLNSPYNIKGITDTYKAKTYEGTREGFNIQFEKMTEADRSPASK